VVTIGRALPVIVEGRGGSVTGFGRLMEELS
jgi:hypothetical protein